MREERLQILQMIKDGTISATEGAKLLAALGEERESRERVEQSMTRREREPRWLRIRVTNKSDNSARVNISIPLRLIDFGLDLVEFGGLNLSAVREAIRGGTEGKILEVDEQDSDERVEIFVE